MDTSRFSHNLQLVVARTHEIAANMGTSYIGSEHLVYAMLVTPECTAFSVLNASRVSEEGFRRYLLNSADRRSSISGYTPRTKHSNREVFTNQIFMVSIAEFPLYERFIQSVFFCQCVLVYCLQQISRQKQFSACFHLAIIEDKGEINIQALLHDFKLPRINKREPSSSSPILRPITNIMRKIKTPTYLSRYFVTPVY